MVIPQGDHAPTNSMAAVSCRVTLTRLSSKVTLTGAEVWTRGGGPRRDRVVGPGLRAGGGSPLGRETARPSHQDGAADAGHVREGLMPHGDATAVIVVSGHAISRVVGRCCPEYHVSRAFSGFSPRSGTPPEWPMARRAGAFPGFVARRDFPVHRGRIECQRHQGRTAWQ